MTSHQSLPSVRIVEVGPRDGLQNIKNTVPTATKLELISRLYSAGLRTIEITSVVSPRAVPQLSDCRAVLSHPDVQTLLGNKGVRAPVLIPNLQGLDTALKQNVREVAVFVSASEGFSRANINCSAQEGLEKARAVAVKAREHGLAVRGYVSCIFSCPYDGPTPPRSVLNCVQRLLSAGCYEVSLGDTIGVGVPSSVQTLIKFLTNAGIPLNNLAGHFHDTYGQAVANIWAAYQCGMRVFDSSVGGLGGCPYAPGAKGNVATEDAVYMFSQAGVSTGGVNLAELVDVGVWISEQLKKQNESRAGSALAAKKLLSPNPSSSPSNTTACHPPKPSLPASLLTWNSHPYPSTPGLVIHRSGPNLRVTLSRPSNGNALTTPMITALTTLFYNSASDSTITRIIIAASGKYFCTGMDLSKHSTPISSGHSASDEQFNRLTRLFEAIDTAPQVTIAVVQGPAFGGGVGLTFACDVRIMSEKASMTLSEAKLGLCAATISKYVIREWGTAFAREAMLSGRAVGAVELTALGVAKITEVGQLERGLEDYLNHLKGSAPRASGMSKELVRLSYLGGGEKQAEGIRELFEEMMTGSEEAKYGLNEFQSGNKKVDWDRYALGKSKPKAKL